MYCRHKKTAPVYVNGEFSDSGNFDPEVCLQGFAGNYGRRALGGGFESWKRDLHEYYNGKLDEFKIYNRVLSPEEIAELYQF
ncbi:MAG: LamG domain-containing protein [Desulfobacterales bacterium]|nr:LamG domain-containing protein [Desulfobacterales bacterium]